MFCVMFSVYIIKAYLFLWLYFNKLEASSTVIGDVEHPIPPKENDLMVSFILKWLTIILLIEGTGLNILQDVINISISFGLILFFFKSLSIKSILTHSNSFLAPLTEKSLSIRHGGSNALFEIWLCMLILRRKFNVYDGNLHTFAPL